MVQAYEWFISAIMVMLFYSFAITTLTYALPADSLSYVNSFSDIRSDLTLDSVATDIEDGLTQQQSIPVIELGALVFYSGNILIDLLLNFIFAFPEMVGLLVNGITTIFNLDTMIFATVQIFATVLMMALYIIALIQLLTNVRSGQLIR